MVCSHKKGNLQKQRERTLHGADGSVVLLSVVGLQNHKTLVALEGFTDMFYPGLHLFLLFMFRFLHGIGTLIEREDQDVYNDTDHDYGQTVVTAYGFHDRENKLYKELKRLYEKIV